MSLFNFLMINTAIALIGVGCAFILGKPGLFMKNAAGTLSPLSYLIFWPYFTLNTITLGLFRVLSQENALDKIVPDLYIGCQLSIIDYKRFLSLGIKSTLDLTSEFGEVGFIRTGQNYLSIPLLDTTAPTLNQLEEAVSWITARLSEGPVFVHCALGHGRSATVVAAFLIKAGIVNDIKGAVEFIKAKRSGVDLRSKQLSVLALTTMTNRVRILKKNRQFIRHPTEIPIELWCMAKSCRECKRLSNVSLGGLAFESGINCWQPGTIIGIRIPQIDPSFKTTGRVVWCHKKTIGFGFEIGVELTEPNDAFRTRMVEQICQIEHYRTTLELQGRKLNIEDAAIEWISYYAAEFPLFKNDSAQIV
jgi:protein-tyrosine phosphatase